MKISIGEIVDRYTICRLKSERGHIDNSKEIGDLESEIRTYTDLQVYIDQLYKLNGEVWDLESDIRGGNEDKLGLEEIGRRALKLRDMNVIRIRIKNEINSKYHEGYIEIKAEHGSERYPSVIITLTTVPERLDDTKEDGLKLVIESLCTQDDDEYEVHFNIPEINKITGKQYIIPEWLHEYKLRWPHLKIFRSEDMGPPTKLIPTIERVINPDTIILVVDDDLVYDSKMISEHRNYQSRLHQDAVICYEGRDPEIRLHGAGDIRDCWVLCVTQIREVHTLMHYKSVSYRKRMFDQDLYDYYLGRTFSDDSLMSKYLTDKNIRMYVVPYGPENHFYETKELWEQHHGVTTFPVLRHSSGVAFTGCNHPKMLEHPLGERFYWPTTLGDRSFKGTFPPVIEETVQPTNPE